MLLFYVSFQIHQVHTFFQSKYTESFHNINTDTIKILRWGLGDSFSMKYQTVTLATFHQKPRFFNIPKDVCMILGRDIENEHKESENRKNFK